MISIGDVCPIFFNPLKYRYSSGGRFRQVFAPSDGIRLQVFCDGGEVPSVSLNDRIGGSSSSVSMSVYDVNDGVRMHHALLTPGEGIYTVTVDGKESEEFLVCSDTGDSVLIEYSHKDNNSAFDNIFWIGGERQTFRFRVTGGFKPDGVGLGVENEQFANQRQELEELYAVPYRTMDFVIGSNSGVPYYIAEFVNRILCLSSVSIDGSLYVREGDSVPERTDTIGGKQMFIYKVTLRPSTSAIAGIGGRPEEAVSSSGVAFMLDSPEEDDVLKYKRSRSAFVNENYV